ncbi:MAG: hypothetical protein Ct9H90mP6_01720 [Gammaproteobacteria bacterium]|nr:MAG: hypothetical protein Ct9H90mP6_01720 [Gammaproteobacteria bacterium]
MNKNIFYFHGFASSADSTKAKVFDDFIKEKFPDICLHIPNIDNSIEKSFIQLEDLVEENKGVIDYSLGAHLVVFMHLILLKSLIQRLC